METITPQIIDDPLACPACDIKTGMPLIKDGTMMRFTIRTPEKKVNQEKGTERVEFRAETTKPCYDTENNELQPGYKIVVRINGASGERKADALARDLASLIQAVEGKASKTTPRQIWDNPALFDGKVVDAKVKIQAGKNGFNDQNILTYLPPA